MRRIFSINPKSYLYGEELLELALYADKLAEGKKFRCFLYSALCPYTTACAKYKTFDHYCTSNGSHSARTKHGKDSSRITCRSRM